MNAPKVLIIRYSAIGDIVMALPTASRVRRAKPEAFIAWVLEDRYVDLVSAKGLVNHIEGLPWQEWKRRRWTPGGFFAPLRVYARLRKMEFDVGIDLQGHSKTALCLRVAKPKRRISARATDLMARSINPLLPAKDQRGHSVEVNLRTLDVLGDFEASSEPILPELDIERRQVPAGSKPLATVCVGAGHPSKVYPIESWNEVGRLLAPSFDVAFLGGPSDLEPNVEGALNLVGRLSIKESMAWVAQSAVHLAADTGTGHIAAAYGVPVVSVFGPFKPSVFRPYTERCVLLRQPSGKPADVLPAEIAAAAAKLVPNRP